MQSSATLDTTAKILTALVLAILAFIIYQGLQANNTMQAIVTDGSALCLMAVIIFCWLYAPRSYAIDNGKLTIKRRLKNKEVSLDSLKSITHYPEKMKGLTLRTFGNGGLFGYFGKYYNSAMGNFNMYSTKGKDFYVLDLGKSKIGISPDQKEFVEALKGYLAKS